MKKQFTCGERWSLLALTLIIPSSQFAA